MSDQSRCTTDIRGTRGYVAPEWFKRMAITAKVDVYSFGIMWLEIICCRINFEQESWDEKIEILSDWAYDCYVEIKLHLLVENVEQAKNDWKMLERLVMTAIWCIQEDPSLRPSMKKDKFSVSDDQDNDVNYLNILHTYDEGVDIMRSHNVELVDTCNSEAENNLKKRKLVDNLPLSSKVSPLEVIAIESATALKIQEPVDLRDTVTGFNELARNAGIDLKMEVWKVDTCVPPSSSMEQLSEVDRLENPILKETDGFITSTKFTTRFTYAELLALAEGKKLRKRPTISHIVSNKFE
ncbi:hypothetical protein GIB67_038091 [Kingdonia uniflora]|uniref:Protein kinase domain-containing protein n=1 Tax=Kingdonia uniflora TaxID=39325 RepID=A0A7J7P7U7_9MAGN|nr:hypothetical protein GIB67_038091 [Kingdonia uniflora]